MSNIKLYQENPKFSLIFGDSELGRLYEDDNGLLSFSGDVNDSAEVFINHLCKKFNSRNLEQENAQLKGLSAAYRLAYDLEKLSDEELQTFKIENKETIEKLFKLLDKGI